ncbi:hypothetical protein CH92_00250 [Stutzerimonas stutzeri]|uniref:Uncharacterized protein n=1 Tax=Stutzerimonas stutzeri TaxID=316 RepID=W8QSU7_STUST|nr:hypothetical protein [Stutzerimonas stutzeri]AHL73610.1 hypothetical protein CH92_00250 [Stutzerimonas stutzeri]MCQ4328879.1 hypothetical protein [Stutzerimonas stutzeri]
MNKTILAVCSLLAALALLFGWSLNDALSAPPSVSQVSPQGGHLIESVPVQGLLAPGGGLSYLRIVDRADRSTIFRSPLFATRSVDMRASEDSQSLGVTWIAFDKRTQDFTLSIPQWRPDWRNLFFSNTPYEVVPNG